MRFKFLDTWIEWVTNLNLKIQNWAINTAYPDPNKRKKKWFK